ncbi:MAG TPA: carbohydrate ABC transporter permease [Candidatus Hydrogenedentes bacterium]|nr:carbohydrate ABC transporter permease [Candidatus Hydrogenedentota bacterium]HOL78145.1 carbohydrate ABC transporter permease [Candidatus Hydrogenedentota bacterium]HPO87232.1 carbohydrate ABC transporter permease [Candidatus Hydrogenedentota bacterium]
MRAVTHAKPLELLKLGVLGAVAIFALLPVYFMVVISFKDMVQFTNHPYLPTWPLHFSNYVRAWGYVGPYIGRTLFVAAIATVTTLFLGSLCAFYLAQFRFAGKEVFFYYVIILMMVPGILNLVPLYVLVTQLDNVLRGLSRMLNEQFPGVQVDLRMLNTLWALILPAIAGGQIMMIFILRQFFEAQPAALVEAARIDGASHFQIYRHVALPLAKPIIATLTVINVVAIWNDFVWPLVVLQRDHYTVSVGLRFLEGQNYVEYGPLMAGYTLAAVPLVIMFLFSMKLFIEGIASGAIKM